MSKPHLISYFDSNRSCQRTTFVQTSRSAPRVGPCERPSCSPRASSKPVAPMRQNYLEPRYIVIDQAGLNVLA
eukprot:6202154-Pleurochrysis_carterae.AAC.1